jgi:MoaA/NifB/PqqE/SkfB family radical SAM enzyme
VKCRKEIRGLHFYERTTGLHVLLDEHPIPLADCHETPAVISIALTNACDLTCEFCYAPKTNHRLAPNDVVRWCKELASSGTLEVAFGGGEPTLYRELVSVCTTIWSETDLGISITTHGHYLTENLIKSLQGVVSVIRVSIDGPEPQYSSIRGRSLSELVTKLKGIAGRIPFGINTVINQTTLTHLDEIAALVKELGAVDWLILPEVVNGRFTLSEFEWRALDDWITKRRQDMELRVTSEATTRLKGPFPLEDRAEDYAHISADGHIRRCSYGTGGVVLKDRSIMDAIRELNFRSSLTSDLSLVTD